MKVFERVYHYSREASIYVVDGGAEKCMIDCGFETRVDSFFEEIEQDGLSLDTITTFIVSHAHADHVGGVAKVKRRLGCEVIAHRLAAEPIERGDLIATGALMVYAGFCETFAPCKVDRLIDEGDRLTIGDVELQVFHAPGHTVGSVALRMGDLLFVGDTLFEGGGFGWFDVHWGSNIEDFIDSMRLIKSLEPTHILPAHGPPFEYRPEAADKAIGELERYLAPTTGYGLPRPRKVGPPREG